MVVVGDRHRVAQRERARRRRCRLCVSVPRVHMTVVVVGPLPPFFNAWAGRRGKCCPPFAAWAGESRMYSSSWVPGGPHAVVGNGLRLARGRAGWAAECIRSATDIEPSKKVLHTERSL